MTTESLKGATTNGAYSDAQKSGFGVFAYYTGTDTYGSATYRGAGKYPDFMYNEHVYWDNATSLWKYDNIKYWPNEIASGTVTYTWTSGTPDPEPGSGEYAEGTENPTTTTAGKGTVDSWYKNTSSNTWFQLTAITNNSDGKVDDQNNDTSNDPATGSKTHSYLSFFGYAPWVNRTEVAEAPVPPSSTPTSTDDDGIIALTSNGAESKASYLTYRTASSMKLSESVDLLWAYPQTDRWKLDGAGYTTGMVTMHFIHALSSMRVLVRGVFDHVSPDDTWTEYSDEVADSTKILIDTVEIKSPEVYRQGDLYFVPDMDRQQQPKWENMKDKTGFSFGGSVILGGISNTYDKSGKWVHTADSTGYLGKVAPDDKDAAFTAFDLLPRGVTKTDSTLFADSNPYYVFLPTETEEALKVHVVYHVITYDSRLTLNTPKCISIVTNDITATAGRLKFEPNKRYTLRLLLGLTTVKFEVLEVEDWAVPLQLDAVVTPMYTETKEANVD